MLRKLNPLSWLPALNPLRKLGTVSKLFLVLLITITGFGLSYVAIDRLQSTEKTFDVTDELMNDFTRTALQTKIDVLYGEELVGEFLLTRDPAKQSQFRSTINAANNGTADLEQLAQNDEQQQLIYQVRDAISAYQRVAIQLIENETTIGLDENSGMMGVMRDAAHTLEALIMEERQTAQTDVSKAAALKLQTLYLQMRRGEKDFLDRYDNKYVDRFNGYASELASAIEQGDYNADKKAEMTQQLQAYQQGFAQITEPAFQRSALLTQLATAQSNADGLIDSVIKVTKRTADANEATAATQLQQLNIVFIAVLASIAALIILSLGFLSLGIVQAIRGLKAQVLTMSGNDATVNEVLNRKGNEFTVLATAFDQLLKVRQEQLQHAEKENEKLNDSVINLMDAADRLSKRDLTVVVPVSEDITGNVSDALNQMARETARTMADINNVAAQLEQVASAVRQQGDKVAFVAADERQVVTKALQSLEQSAATMAEMASIATGTNELAGNASDSSKKALGAVRTTVQSMSEIRNSVGETEKSIKRLGERSQEIGAIVEIIKDIAERTHTLALNAGMQAVAAGEAGRGFSVVADEVQRLAETARESTNQITALVNSIQSESSESMATMNKTISQVVTGSELAERAGKRMRLTQKATEDLVGSVAQIAERSKLLESTNRELREQAIALQQSTEATEQELKAQAEQTNTLFKFLQSLVQSVRVFKLPEAA